MASLICSTTSVWSINYCTIYLYLVYLELLLMYLIKKKKKKSYKPISRGKSKKTSFSFNPFN